MLVHEFGQNTLHIVAIKQVHHKIMWYHGPDEQEWGQL